MNHPIRIASAHDVTVFIDRQAGFTGRARAAWFVALGGLFLDAFANASLGSGLSSLTEQFALSPTQVGLLTAVAAVVALVFNPVGGWLADRFGRIRPMIATKLIYMVGVLMMALAPNFETVFGGRILVGASYGIDLSIALALLAEYTPASKSSRLNLWSGLWCIAVAANLGVTLLFYGLGVGGDVWRYSIGTAAVLAFLLLLAQLKFLVESPAWLARLGRMREAAASLGRLYPDDSFIGDDSAPRTTGHRNAGNIAIPFRGVYLRRTILSATISACAYLQYNAIGWYLPIIALALFDGDFVAALLVSIGYNLLGSVGGFASPFLGRRFGLRNIALFGFGAFFLLLVAMGLLDGKISPFLLAVFPALLMLVDFACVSMTGKTMAALSYRSEVRATGTAISGFMTNVGGAIGLFLFPVLRGSLPLGVVILILSIVPLIGFITCLAINWDPSRNEFSADSERDAPGLDPQTIPVGITTATTTD
jgi:MFS family permease